MALGHLSAVAGAVGLAYSTTTWWGGLLGAAGVVLSHYCDVFDGTHARATEQCRNGGELLDHFLDPLSFAYCLVGIAVSCGRLDLGLAAVIILYATAVLTNIKAKLTGEFTLSAFGPTEFKTLLTVYAVGLSAGVATGITGLSTAVGWALAAAVAAGTVQLIFTLVRAVREVNCHGRPADTSEWVTTCGAPAAAQPEADDRPPECHCVDEGSSSSRSRPTQQVSSRECVAPPVNVSTSEIIDLSSGPIPVNGRDTHFLSRSRP